MVIQALIAFAGAGLGAALATAHVRVAVRRSDDDGWPLLPSESFAARISYAVFAALMSMAALLFGIYFLFQ